MSTDLDHARERRQQIGDQIREKASPDILLLKDYIDARDEEQRHAMDAKIQDIIKAYETIKGIRNTIKWIVVVGASAAALWAAIFHSGGPTPPVPPA